MKLSKYKHDSLNSYALGATIVKELFESQPALIRRVFLRPTAKHGADLDKIIADLRANNIEIIESAKAFNILGAKENCLLAAEFQKPTNSLNENTPHIVLVNPSDSGNLGTIIRTAVALNFNNIAIITPAVDPYNPKTIRASMGAIFHLNIEQFDSIEQYQSIHQHQLFAFMLNAQAKTLDEAKAPDSSFALVFGNEAAGLPTDFCAKTGAEAIYIPQSDQVDSLNLSVAAAIAMYHFKK